MATHACPLCSSTTHEPGSVECESTRYNAAVALVIAKRVGEDGTDSAALKLTDKEECVVIRRMYAIPPRVVLSPQQHGYSRIDADNCPDLK